MRGRFPTGTGVSTAHGQAEVRTTQLGFPADLISTYGGTNPVTGLPAVGYAWKQLALKTTSPPGIGTPPVQLTGDKAFALSGDTGLTPGTDARPVRVWLEPDKESSGYIFDTCPGYGADYTTARAGVPFGSGVPAGSTPLVFTDADPGCVQVVPYTAVEIPDGVDTAVVWGRLAATMTMAGTIGPASLAEVSAGVVFLDDGGDLATLGGTGIPVGWEWADDGGGGGVVSGYLLARQKYIKDGDGLAVNVARSDGYVEWYLHVDTAEAKALLGVTTVRLAWAVGLPSVGGFGASWTMDVFPTWRGPSWLTWRPACGLRDPITNALAGSCGGGSGSVSPPVPPSPPSPPGGPGTNCGKGAGDPAQTVVITGGTEAGTYTTNAWNAGPPAYAYFTTPNCACVVEFFGGAWHLVTNGTLYGVTDETATGGACSPFALTFGGSSIGASGVSVS